jgi:hypothetical protein
VLVASAAQSLQEALTPSDLCAVLGVCPASASSAQLLGLDAAQVGAQAPLPHKHAFNPVLHCWLGLRPSISDLAPRPSCASHSPPHTPSPAGRHPL